MFAFFSADISLLSSLWLRCFTRSAFFVAPFLHIDAHFAISLLLLDFAAPFLTPYDAFLLSLSL